VISGTFLIDSESRMKAPGIFGPVASDPMCGMEVDEKRATRRLKSEYEGKTYYSAPTTARSVRRGAGEARWSSLSVGQR